MLDLFFRDNLKSMEIFAAKKKNYPEGEMIKTIKQIKKIIVGIIGFTILFIGVLLIVLPGPAFIVIPLGLGILATEFVWARKILNKDKDKFKKKTNNLK